MNFTMSDPLWVDEVGSTLQLEAPHAPIAGVGCLGGWHRI